MRLIAKAAVVAGVAFAGAQLVPYGWRHSNPPVAQDAPWPSAATRTLAVRACYDCHSNESKYPVYSYVAPMSWLVRHDIDGGRAVLNFSLFGQGENKLHDAADAVEEGWMPPRKYLLLHPDAKLSAAEKRELAAALEAMDEADGGGGRRGPNRGPGGSGSGSGSGSNSGPGSGSSGD
jgi:uncharacterized membrane protein YgcG